MCVFLWPLVLTLRARVPDVVERRLAPVGPAGPAVPLEMHYVPDARSGVTTSARRLNVRDPTALAGHANIDLMVATFVTGPQLVDATLELLGTGCVFRTAANARFPNNGYLRFSRLAGCNPRVRIGTGEVDLTIRFRGHARTAVWSAPATAAATPDEALFWFDRTIADAGQRLVVAATLVDEAAEPSARRVDLLAYVWQVADTPGWIWVAVATAGALILAGALGLTGAARREVRVAAAMGALGSGLCLLYAVLVPPFHAPDEPSHFLTYATETGQPHVAAYVVRWQQLAHFRRMLDATERFRPSDVGRPLAGGLTATSLQQHERSVVAPLLWKAARPIHRLRPPRQLLALRLLNVVIAGAALAAATALLIRSCDVLAPHAFAAFFLLIPAFPLFAMHVSNYAHLTAEYVLISTAVAMLLCDSPRSFLAGIPLGAGMGLALSTSRNAYPLAVFVAGLLVLRMALGGRGDDRRRPQTRARIFWGGASLMLLPSLAGFGEFLFSGPTPDASVRYAAYAGHLLAVPLVAGYLWERRRATTHQTAASPRAGRVVTRLAFVAAAGIVALLAGSVFLAYPTVTPVDLASRPPPLEYVTRVLLSAATSLRLVNPDALLFTSFWLGFGWLEMGPWPVLSSAIAIGIGALLAGLLIRLGRRGDTRRLVIVFAASGAFWVTLAVYAYATLRWSPDLHGRYLIGLYSGVLPLAAGVIALGEAPSRPSWRAWLWRHRVEALLGTAAVMHGYCLTSILSRYF